MSTVWGQVPYVMPGLSHGTAGVVLALARAAALLGRADLLDLARAGARRLLALGQRADGTVAVPHLVPQHPLVAPQSRGWCHGPTGTVQAFLALADLERGWDAAVAGSLAALRASGVLERRYPGSGTAYGSAAAPPGCSRSRSIASQATSDAAWLNWAGVLAEDLLDRATEVPGGDLVERRAHRRRPGAAARARMDAGHRRRRRRPAALRAGPARRLRRRTGSPGQTERHDIGLDRAFPVTQGPAIGSAAPQRGALASDRPARPLHDAEQQVVQCAARGGAQVRVARCNGVLVYHPSTQPTGCCRESWRRR